MFMPTQQVTTQHSYNYHTSALYKYTIFTYLYSHLYNKIQNPIFVTEIQYCACSQYMPSSSIIAKGTENTEFDQGHTWHCNYCNLIGHTEYMYNLSFGHSGWTLEENTHFQLQKYID